MFYCGIDVAKRKHAVVVLDDRGHVQKPVFETENTHAELNSQVTRVRISKTFECSPCGL